MWAVLRCLALGFYRRNMCVGTVEVRNPTSGEEVKGQYCMVSGEVDEAMRKEEAREPVVVTLDDVVDPTEITVTKNGVAQTFTLREAQELAYLVQQLKSSKSSGVFLR